MHLLSIAMNDKSEVIKNIADKILHNYKYQGVNINYSILDNGKENTINFYIDNKNLINNEDYPQEDITSDFKHYSAIAITDYIVDGLEVKLIDKILQSNYSFLSNDERKFILNQLNFFLENEFYYDNMEIPYKINRKAKTLYKIIDFLTYNDTIHVMGFLKFRLKSYFEELNDVIDRAIEEYMMEKEYKEFIKLLKYFVNIQEPKIDVLNIIVDKDGRYHLHDENLKAINDDYIRALAKDFVDNDLSYDDLLISALITIAPKKIVIHYASNIKNKEIIETIKNIFDKSLYMCNNCRICNLNKEAKEE